MRNIEISALKYPSETSYIALSMVQFPYLNFNIGEGSSRSGLYWIPFFERAAEKAERHGVGVALKYFW